MFDREREKVIKGLECRLDINGSKYKHCLTCDYRHDIDHGQWACQTDGILEDALALLKAQEARVLTLDEALNSLVIEYRSGKLREVGKHVFAEGLEYYGNIWRVWDRMPTDQQRKNEPWEQ